MKQPDILCIGAVLWDIIGRTNETMSYGNDRPGRITRLPGGVALNIAMATTRFGLSAALLSVVGKDPEGHSLLSAVSDLGIDVGAIFQAQDLPTDCYMAVESPNGLAAACADAHSLERAGDRILAALSDGRLATQRSPYSGIIALDGNLTLAVLTQIAASPLFEQADLRIAPASPGKADRLKPLLPLKNATIYVNLEEACLLCDTPFETSEQAAQALLDAGANRVLVTNGSDRATDASQAGIITADPQQTIVRRITGAGDTFMAGHIAAEHQGKAPAEALDAALCAAAQFISTEGI